MSHYWTADDHPAARQAQIEDWIADLVEFDLEVIEFACREWRRKEIRRPLPAQIRDLAEQETGHRRSLKQQSLPPTYDTLSRECRNEWLSCRARWLVRGFICHAECRSRIQEYYPREVESDGTVPRLEQQRKIVDLYFGSDITRIDRELGLAAHPE
jgi:hypothetical protein